MVHHIATAPNLFKEEVVHYVEDVKLPRIPVKSKKKEKEGTRPIGKDYRLKST